MNFCISLAAALTIINVTSIYVAGSKPLSGGEAFIKSFLSWPTTKIEGSNFFILHASKNSIDTVIF